jgi:predicted NBD/HSP70 family sugar kinase
MVHVPVELENDAKMAALSEAAALKGVHSRVMYITISTGIGAGMVVDGRLDIGLSNCEPGHMYISYGGTMTKWQDFASGRAIVAKYGKRASEITDADTWSEICTLFAIGLQPLIAIVQPDAIVFGGGVGGHFDRFGHLLVAEMKQYDLPMAPIPALLEAKNPDEAVIYGCYYLLKP